MLHRATGGWMALEAGMEGSDEQTTATVLAAHVALVMCGAALSA